jgi:GAF domain-containing protein
LNSKKVNKISDSQKTVVYEAVVKQICSVLSEELSDTAKMSSIAAILHNEINYFDWTGFYVVVAVNELEIGAYQGHLACLKIPFDRGVCGYAAREEKSIVVDDVSKFPGYIACDANSQSEIVVPVFRNNAVIAVLDVDSDQKAAFNEVDQKYLEQIVALI